MGPRLEFAINMAVTAQINNIMPPAASFLKKYINGVAIFFEILYFILSLL
jgi:hypothetical protein